jgi:5'-3' exonuclease
MGIPKYYRWISERYPCLSRVVREHEVGSHRVQGGPGEEERKSGREG